MGEPGSDLGREGNGTPWPTERPVSVDDCVRALMRPGFEGECAYHAAHKRFGAIRSKFDSWFERPGPRLVSPVEAEARLLNAFCEQGWLHLPPAARMHIEYGRLAWDTRRTTGAMFVGCHYGLPTRCVDWTRSPLVALFFACRRAPGHDGEVWWMSDSELTTCLVPQWPICFGKTGDIEGDFERQLVKGEQSDVLVRLDFPKWMPRASAQHAFVTVGGCFGMSHDVKIYGLGMRACGRLVVPSRLKAEVLEYLDKVGVNGHTLGIGNSTVETIAGDLCADLGE